jgi:hypothetical protein
MDRELARKRPAVIVREQSLTVTRHLPRQDFLDRPFHERHALVAQVQQMARRGEISQAWTIRGTRTGWRVDMIRLREPGRRWVKPTVITGAALVAAGLVWLTLLALQALAAAVTAVAPALGGVVLLLVMLGVVAVLTRGSTVIEVIQKVTILK